MDMTDEELIKTVVGCAYDVRSELMPGYLEIVYRNAMVCELHDHNLRCETEFPINIYYKGHCVGEYRADIVVERRLIIELKAVNTLLPIHEMQLVNYLTATGIDNGILINFGGERMEVRRKFRTYKPSHSSLDTKTH